MHRASPATQAQQRPNLAGCGAGSNRYRAPAVAQGAGAFLLEQLVVPDVVAFPLVLGVAGPAIELDDQGERVVADVSVPSPSGLPLRAVVGRAWQPVRPLHMSDVVAFQRALDPLPYFGHQVQDEPAVAHLGPTFHGLCQPRRIGDLPLAGPQHPVDHLLCSGGGPVDEVEHGVLDPDNRWTAGRVHPVRQG
ncbi:MAG: hypothetical protein H0U35_13700 [Sporichthyaceae bacterium]|nr:hypothetical protein [Sporichthyaceae bacterium]